MSVTSRESDTKVGHNDAIWLKVKPNKNTPKSYMRESWSNTGVYEEAADKLWLVTKSIKQDGKQIVRCCNG